jgi:hypothetical protein
MDLSPTKVISRYPPQRQSSTKAVSFFSWWQRHPLHGAKGMGSGGATCLAGSLRGYRDPTDRAACHRSRIPTISGSWIPSDREVYGMHAGDLSATRENAYTASRILPISCVSLHWPGMTGCRYQLAARFQHSASNWSANRRDLCSKASGYVVRCPMTELWNYTFETIWDDGTFILSQAISPGQTSPILVTAPAHAQPTTMNVAQLEHAYALRNELETSWAARPFELVHHRGKRHS